MHMVRALMCFVGDWSNLDFKYWAISSISLKITLHVHWGNYNPGQLFFIFFLNKTSLLYSLSLLISRRLHWNADSTFRINYLYEIQMYLEEYP